MAAVLILPAPGLTFGRRAVTRYLPRFPGARGTVAAGGPPLQVRMTAPSCDLSVKLRCRGNGVHAHRPGLSTDPPPSAGPPPFRRRVHQPTAHRIRVDVSDECRDCSPFAHVPVESASRLPESKDGPVAFIRRQTVHPLMLVVPLQKPSCAPGYRPLDRKQESADVVRWTAGVHEQVHVLRHEHVGPQSYILFLACFLKCVCKPLPGSVFGEERQSIVTGEGQMVGIAGNVEAPATFAVGTFLWHMPGGR